MIKLKLFVRREQLQSNLRAAIIKSDGTIVTERGTVIGTWKEKVA